MAGFRWVYNVSGGDPLILEFVMKDTETLTKGDLLNLETGEVDLGATNDTDFVGVCLETVSGTDSTTKVRAICNPDAVYAVVDANARVAGATLDIAGATGAMGLATSSNVDVVVVKDSSASEDTLVMFAHGEHYMQR